MQEYCDLILLDNHHRILMIQRDCDDRIAGPGAWSLVGGRLQLSETPLIGIIRETEEEIGLKIRSPKLLGIVEDEWNGKSVKHHIFMLLVGKFHAIQLQEGVGYAWLTIDEIAQLGDKLVPWFNRVYSSSVRLAIHKT
ncbi:MAG: NUDIX hydrolase [Patescibacteria group bacterium]